MKTTCALAEGWAAGLQLAALATRAARAVESPEPPSVDAELLIHDYVWNEVLASEPPDLVQVLLDISVVERVDPRLSLALTGRPDVGDLLLQAEARGLFVSRLGPDGWFEVHALVRSALVGRLSATSPHRLRHQHLAAARWFEAADEVTLSLDHWLLAGDRATPCACWHPSTGTSTRRDERQLSGELWTPSRWTQPRPASKP